MMLRSAWLPDFIFVIFRVSKPLLMVSRQPFRQCRAPVLHDAPPLLCTAASRGRLPDAASPPPRRPGRPASLTSPVPPGRAGALNALFDEWRAIRAGEPIAGLMRLGSVDWLLASTNKRKPISRKFRKGRDVIMRGPCCLSRTW